MLLLSNNALSYDNQLSEAYVFRGWYHQERGNPELAIEEYNKAIQLNPNDWFAYYLKGDAYGSENLVEKIENRHIAMSLNRGQQLPEIINHLINNYCQAGFLEEAEYFTQESFKLHRDSSLYYGNLHFIEATRGNYYKAIELLKKQNLLNEDRGINQYLGYYSTMIEVYEKALEYFKIVLENPDLYSKMNLFAIHRIGLAYWNSGYKEEGEYFFNEQIKILNEINALGRGIGDSIRTSYDLAAVYSFLGEKEKAYHLLERFYKPSVAGLYGVNLIKMDPFFKTIREEPRFQEIINEKEAKYQAEHERVRQWLEENDML